MWGRREEVLTTKNGTMYLVHFFGKVSLLARDRTEQSGAYMNTLWNRAFRALPRAAYKAQHVIFLGVGLGGALHIAHKRFPQARITGVEWDPLLCSRARTLLPPNSNVEILPQDAAIFMQTCPPADMLCVDLFLDQHPAPCLHDPAFLHLLAKQSGIVLVNVYKHHEILDALDLLTPNHTKKRAKYYRSIVGIYESPRIRS